MTQSYRYVTCDVFTNTVFGGNQLAVILDARGLSDAQMQAVAREFNFAETTFVLPAQHPQHTARVRIFTPARELPFAGHPTIGTAFALASLGLIPAHATDIVLEEGVGPVPVRVERDGERVTRCTLTAARLPQLEETPPAIADLTATLSLDAADITEPAECWSCGVPFIVTPLRSVQALERCRIDLGRWEQTFQGRAVKELYVVAQVNATTWRVRMFAPELGVIEDPATGSAAAGFAGWLARRNLHAPHSGTQRYTLLQGQEIGRPSTLALEVDVERGEARAVRVGGASVLVCSGELFL